MAISRNTGTGANNSGSVTSLALPALGTTSGRDVLFAIALGSTASSVSSISNSAGSYSGVALVAGINGTGVRTELWKAHVVTGASTIFTVNITGGATSVAAVSEEYLSISSFGNTATGATAADNYPHLSVVQQDGNNWTVAAFGFACQSGDTMAASGDTSVANSVPAATAVGVYMFDNSSVLKGTVLTSAFLSTARNWAAAATELRTGVGVTSVDYAAVSAPAGSGQPTWQTGHPDFIYIHVVEPLSAQSGLGTPVSVGSILQSATVGIAYSETLSVQSGTSPYSFSITSGALPSGLSLNSSTGVISGTPTTAATYTFTVRVSDALGLTNSQSFQIIVTTASSGGEFSYSYGG